VLVQVQHEIGASLAGPVYERTGLSSIGVQIEQAATERPDCRKGEDDVAEIAGMFEKPVQRLLWLIKTAISAVDPARLLMWDNRG
jgi:hypothetical protein